MNITIAKSELVKLASRMAGVAERKSTMPVLSNVLLQADAGRLGLVATDLYVSLNGNTTAEITKSGSVAVLAKEFVDRVKTMPDGPIALTSGERGLVMKSVGASRKFTLRSMAGEDFPPVPRPNGGGTMTLEAATLSALINLSIFSISTDETRPHLNSALLEVDNGIVRMVSTDGHRLSKVERPIDKSYRNASLLLPLKAIREVQRLSDEANAASGDDPKLVTINTSGSHAFFLNAGLVFGAKLVDAQFPPYTQVIPRSCEHTVRVNRFSLLDAVRAVAVSSSDRTNGIRLALSKNKIELFSESADSGDGSDEVSCEYSGPSMAIGFAARYLVDVLAALSCDEVTIGLGGELDPIIVKPADGAFTEDLWIVMPLRL